MGITAAIAAGVGAAAAAAGTGYSIYASNEAEDRQKAAMAEQQKQADEAAAEFKKQQDEVAQEKKNQATLDRANSTANNAAASAKSRAAGAYGKSDTILTSPLGIPNNAGTTGGKTLLGL